MLFFQWCCHAELFLFFAVFLEDGYSSSVNAEMWGCIPMCDASLLLTTLSYNSFQKWFKLFFMKKRIIFYPTGGLWSVLWHSYIFLGIQLKLIPLKFYNHLLITVNIILEAVLPWNICPGGVWREAFSLSLHFAWLDKTDSCSSLFE